MTKLFYIISTPFENNIKLDNFYVCTLTWYTLYNI